MRGCFNCGERVGVMEFRLLRGDRKAGHWRLCGPCWEWGQGKDGGLDPDPLYVPA